LPICAWDGHNFNICFQFPQNRHVMALESDNTASAGSQMLVGQALLAKARSLSNRPEDQIARACGYVGPSGRLLKKSFYRALVEAKGYVMPSALPAGAGGGSKGRQAEFRTRVHGNGNLLIGHAYTRRMGLEPGQEFRIELHKETGSIWLSPIEHDEQS
jgi:hypothetical protein